ncbi:eCIS core domain-containing protein [Micromonospora sp. IBSANI012]|uniref:eCIS core domain-containing protein n=1 Tax=Micromonospora sp. IBSANI012 TaxID=3457761 RepID=UPI004058C950
MTEREAALHAAPAPDRDDAPARDEALAALTSDLVGRWAPALGLRPDAVRVHLGDAGRRAGNHGARGLFADGALYLAPGFDPQRAAGRALLAHELGHLAQASAAPGAYRNRTDPEAEARQLAEAAAAGRPLWAPAARLPTGAVAADTGAVGTAPSPPATTAAASETETETGLLESQLSEIVDRRYRAERARLIDLLDGLWVSGDDVRGCLRVLDTMPFLVARNLVHSLPANRRTDLARNLDDDHHRLYPGAALAALGGQTPYLLRVLEAGNVHGFSTEGLGAVEQRTALNVLRALRTSVLRELLTGDRKAYFRGLLTGRPPRGTDADALREQVRALRGVDDGDVELDRDTGLAEQLRRAERLIGERRAAEALDLLAALAPAPPTASGPASAGPPEPGPRLLHVVRRLDEAGRIDALLDHLPWEEKRIGATLGPRLLVVLAGREEHQNLTRIEGLLSYGVFDWAIRDHEARFAYLLVRSLPLPAQDRWRRLEQGRWFDRLEENIPAEDILAGRYTGVGGLAEPLDPARRSAGQVDADQLVADIHENVRTELDGVTSVELVRRLIGYDRPVGAPADATGRGREALRTAIHRLDALRDLDRILDALPDAYLTDELRRTELLELLALRDPAHLERQVRQLLDIGLTDWAVNPREAWLAFQLVRNLPVADQARLEAEDPDRWARMRSGMTPEMRTSLAVTAISGPRRIEARDQLRDRLRDSRLWRAERATELRSLIIQLYALDDRRWVFLRSRDVRADRVPELAALVDDLRLYHAERRPSFDPEMLRTDGAPTVVGELARAVLVGLKLIFLSRTALSMFTQEVTLREFDLHDAQWISGDLGGARLRDTDREHTNELSMSVDARQGVLRIRLPRLELDGVNRTFTGSSLRTGRVTLTGLDIVASFSDRGYERPVGAQAGVTSLNVSDVVYASDSLPGGLLGLTRFGLSHLSFGTGATGQEDVEEPSRRGWIGIPVINPLIHLLHNVISFYGGLPFLSKISDALLAPATGGAPFLARQFTSLTAGEIFTPLANATIGLLTDGVFRPPRTVGERATDAVAMLHSLRVSFASATAEGLSFAGMQQVGRIEVGRTLIGLGNSLPARLRAEQESLRLRIGQATGEGRAALEQRLSMVTTELTRLQPLEQELHQLEGRHRWHAESLTEAERRRLVELSDQLRQSAGGTLDIGGIRVTGLTGRVEAAGLEIDPIHGEGSVPSRSGEYLPDDELIARFRRDRTAPDVATLARASTASVTAAGVRLLPAADGQPALRVTAAELPTREQIAAQLRVLPDEPQWAARRAELTRWLTDLDRLRELESLPAEPVDAAGRDIPGHRTPAQEQELQELRERARRYFGLSIGGLTATGLSAAMTPATLGAEIRLAEVTATDVHTGATTVDRVQAHRLRVRADLDIDVAAPPAELDADVAEAVRPADRALPAELAGRATEAGLPAHRAAAGFGIGDLTVTGLSGPAMTAGRIAFTAPTRVDGSPGEAIHGRVVPRGDDLELPDLVVEQTELSGVAFRSARRTIYTRGSTRLGRLSMTVLVHTERAASERRVRSARIRTVTIDRIDADRLGMDVVDPAPGYSVEAVSGSLIGFWMRDLDLDLTGEEMVYSGRLGITELDRLRFTVISRALQGPPTTITGTLGGHATRPAPGASGEPASSVTVDLIKVGDHQVDPDTGRIISDPVDEFRTQLDGVALTDTTIRTADGAVTIRRAGLSGRIVTEQGGGQRFEDVGPSRIELAAIDWQAGAGRIVSRGPTVLDGVTVTGRWDSTPARRDDHGTEHPATADLHVTDLRIHRITGRDLRYRQGDLDIGLGRATPVPAGEPDLPPLEILNVHAEKLHWSRGAGIVAGRLTTGASRAEIAGRVSAAMRVDGSLSADRTRLAFGRGGRIEAEVTGAEGHVGAGEHPGEHTYHAGFQGLDTGVVRIGPDRIDIGPEGTRGLTLAILSLDALNWHNDTLGLLIRPGEGAITMSGITARARIDLTPPGRRRLLLRELVVAETRATGLVVTLAGGVAIRLDPEQEAVLGELRVRPAADQGGFVVEQSGEDVRMLGGLDLGAISAPRVGFDISTFLSRGSADFAATGLAVDFLDQGGLRLDLREPTLTAIQAQVTADPGRELRLLGAPGGRPEYGLRFTSIGYEQGPEGEQTPAARRVTAAGGEVTGLTFTDTGLGLYVFVERGLLGNVTHDLNTGAGRLPWLDIRDARFTLDVGALLGAPTPAGRTTSRERRDDMARQWDALLRILNTYNLGEVLDSLNGRLDFDVVHSGFVWGERTWEARLTFHDGALDYRRMTDALPWWTPGSFTLDGEDLVYRVTLPAPADPMDPNPPPPADIDLLRWRLPTGEVRQAGEEHLIRLNRLLRPTPESRDDLLHTIADFGSDTPSAPGQMEIRNVHADLSVNNPREITLPLGSGNEIVLAPDALMGLRIFGGMGRDAGGQDLPGALRPVRLSSATVARVNLLFRDLNVSTGQIRITDLTDCSLTFDGLNPGLLEGRITRAVAENIRWQRPSTGGTP